MSKSNTTVYMKKSKTTTESKRHCAVRHIWKLQRIQKIWNPKKQRYQF